MVLPKLTKLILCIALITAAGVFLFSEAAFAYTPSVMEGYVRDDVTGEPIPGVTVTFLRLANGHKESCFTDSNGYYSFTIYYSGDYFLSVHWFEISQPKIFRY